MPRTATGRSCQTGVGPSRAGPPPTQGEQQRAREGSGGGGAPTFPRCSHLRAGGGGPGLGELLQPNARDINHIHAGGASYREGPTPVLRGRAPRRRAQPRGRSVLGCGSRCGDAEQCASQHRLGHRTRRGEDHSQCTPTVDPCSPHNNAAIRAGHRSRRKHTKEWCTAIAPTSSLAAHKAVHGFRCHTRPKAAQGNLSGQVHLTPMLRAHEWAAVSKAAADRRRPTAACQRAHANSRMQQGPNTRGRRQLWIVPGFRDCHWGVPSTIAESGN